METRTACIIGWPVEHSRSPVIHRFWLRQLGIAGDYVVAPVEPERIGEFFADFGKTGFVGGNVTIPHKEAAFAAVAEMDAAARAIGAVNTIWLDDGAPARGEHRRPRLPRQSRPGGARLGRGTGRGRGPRRGRCGARRGLGALRARLRADPCGQPHGGPRRGAGRAFRQRHRPAGWETVAGSSNRRGFSSTPPPSAWRASRRCRSIFRRLNESLLVTDIVYVPLMTPLLAAARARGLKTVDGLGMLLHQAVPGFERWFGVRPEVSPELREAVLATMRKP